MEEEPGFRTLQTNRWRGGARPRRDMKKKGKEVGSNEEKAKMRTAKKRAKEKKQIFYKERRK